MASHARRSGYGSVRSGVVAAFFSLASTAALAQGISCSRLQAEITSLHGDPAQTQRFLAAAQRQQRDLDRTASYAHAIGCDNRQFLFFGSPPPPQCAQLNPQIQRLQANLRQLQLQASAASGESQRRDLTAQYNSSCRGGTQASLQGPRSFFEQLFGGGAAPSRPTETVPINPEVNSQPADQSARGGSKAVCVRTCDGGFFPVSFTASRSKFDELQAQCTALCPNAETTLFTYPTTGVIDQAVSPDGKPYSSLPNADLFKTHYDPACTCRPPHQSWAQALAGAERTFGDRRSDIIVTPEKSEQMAQPTASPSPLAHGKAGKGKSAAKTDSQGQTADDATAADIANSAAAPTEGQESADIGAGAAVKGKTYGEHDGRVVEEAGPDGVKRRVRIVGQ